MNSKFQWTFFSDCNLQDTFFDSLKEDYAEFENWFIRKSKEGAKVCIYRAKSEILALLYLKDETEQIVLNDCQLPEKRRLKIGTLKIGDYAKHQRLGEGAIGLALWYWQKMNANEVYITVFAKQKQLINLLQKFGFKKIGENRRGEGVYIKNKGDMDYTTPYKAFPYLSPQFPYSGYIPIKAEYHDTLFPYSELANTNQETEEIAAANGITKIFIASPARNVEYKMGEPVFIYRIHTGEGPKKYKSVVTSICTIVRQITVKSEGVIKLSYEEFCEIIANKSYFKQRELEGFYQKRNLILLEMVYNGGFGKGHNVTYHSLATNGLFDKYPYDIKLDYHQFRKILSLGGINVRNFIID